MESVKTRKCKVTMDRGAGRVNYDQDSFLVEGLLDENSLAGFYGPSGSRKSFLIIDIACRVATGKPWQGLDVKQGSVIYVAAEGSNGMIKRMNAWVNKYNNGEDIKNFYRISQPMFVSKQEYIEDLILATEDVLFETGMPVRLIVIDTLARCFTGNENAAEDMGAFIAGCDQIKVKSGATILIVHHTGKDIDRGAKGAYSFKAALDNEYFVTKDEDKKNLSSRLVCTKSKDGNDELDISIGLKIETLGRTIKGKVIDTLVVIDGEHDNKNGYVNSNDRSKEEKITKNSPEVVSDDY
ncbi:helicase RepA family protein [Aeromonas allosaccharophila]|uniref:Helicase RepA family protein n=1 Tax=Aeromonas allosaccharophila TaxID=656 RepID=A0ABZ0FDY0_9GAMM|nr:helicase RepA family protein [Aeromonas allosaccharophila]WOE67655.1 helicase RepA family protein [Aeromonas allosaccharophila]